MFTVSFICSSHLDLLGSTNKLSYREWPHLDGELVFNEPLLLLLWCSICKLCLTISLLVSYFENCMGLNPNIVDRIEWRQLSTLSLFYSVSMRLLALSWEIMDGRAEIIEFFYSTDLSGICSLVLCVTDSRKVTSCDFKLLIVF